MEKAASMHINEVFEALNASPNGLATEEAETRLKKYGFNTLVEKKQTSILYKFIAHFKDLFGVFAEEIRKFFARRLSKTS